MAFSRKFRKSTRRTMHKVGGVGTPPGSAATGRPRRAAAAAAAAEAKRSRSSSGSSAHGSSGSSSHGSSGSSSYGSSGSEKQTRKRGRTAAPKKPKHLTASIDTMTDAEMLERITEKGVSRQLLGTTITKAKQFHNFAHCSTNAADRHIAERWKRYANLMVEKYNERRTEYKEREEWEREVSINEIRRPNGASGWYWPKGRTLPFYKLNFSDPDDRRPC